MIAPPEIRSYTPLKSIDIEAARRKREQSDAEIMKAREARKKESETTAGGVAPEVANRVRRFQGAMFPQAQTKPLWMRQEEDRYRKFLEHVPGGGINGTNIKMRMRERGLDV
jgi:hypothetical protein